MHYWSHRGRAKHVTSLSHRIFSGLLLPVVLVLLVGMSAVGFTSVPDTITDKLLIVMVALGTSFLRLIVAYIFSLIIGVSLGLLTERSKKIEGILLPIFDVLESMPILAFFPVIIILFLKADFLEGAAIFIIFFSMVWNIAFSVVGGLRQTPADIIAVGTIFGMRPIQKLQKLLLPAIFPSMLTGSILAVAQGWNVLIVAEALHAYSPQSAQAHDLFGIGSMLVGASLDGNTSLLIFAMGVLVVAIALVNIFLWQPLLAYAERYKFE